MPALTCAACFCHFFQGKYFMKWVICPMDSGCGFPYTYKLER